LQNLFLKKINSKLNNIYPVPQVLNKLLLVIDDPLVDIHEIANIVKQDQSFTLQLLKLANSAYFAPTNIKTVNDAVMLLGFNTVKQLAIQAGIIQQLGINCNKPAHMLTKLWKHSVAVAVAAKAIAKFMKREDDTVFFTAGILHDVGLMLEYRFFKKEFYEIIERSQAVDCQLTDLEKELLGVDHTEISCMLLDHWQLPEELKGPIAHHHAPQAARENEKMSAAILRLADVIAIQDGLNGPYGHADAIAPESLRVLNINKEDLEVLVTTYQHDIRDVFPYFENKV
jgi:putative nucleotidyltransferase with HDIG domain